MRIERLRLKKLNNTRDLGGMPAAGGKVIRRGKLIRSGRLYKLPQDTVDALRKMGLTTVVDMRTERERTENPSTVIEGVKYYHIPLTCTATTGITHEKSMASTMFEESKRLKNEFGNADNYMQSMYEIILFSDFSRRQLKAFFDIVAQEEGCILWHCAAGKDRTGIAAMLLEWLLGVDEELIVKDFVASDRFQRRKRLPQRLGLVIAPVPRRFKLFLYSQMKAKPQFIRGAMQSIKQKYGTVEQYFFKALGIDGGQIQKIKDKYLI